MRKQRWLIWEPLSQPPKCGESTAAQTDPVRKSPSWFSLLIAIYLCSHLLSLPSTSDSINYPAAFLFPSLGHDHYLLSTSLPGQLASLIPRSHFHRCRLEFLVSLIAIGWQREKMKGLFLVNSPTIPNGACSRMRRRSPSLETHQLRNPPTLQRELLLLDNEIIMYNYVTLWLSKLLSWVNHRAKSHSTTSDSPIVTFSVLGSNK